MDDWITELEKSRGAPKAAPEKPLDPTIFEKGAEWVNENVPVLPTVLGKLGEVGQIGLKAASAIPLALQGEGGKAAGRLGQAAMGIPQFFGIGGDPEYLDPGTVLDEMGVPEGNMGRWDSPIGTFTGRGGLKLLLSVGTDPLMYTGAGLTSAGRSAARVGGAGLAKAPVNMATGRVGSALAAQALEGQRSILTFAGRAVVPRRVSAAVLGAGEMGVRKLAQGPMKGLARFSGFPEVKKGAVVGGIEGGIEKIRAFKGEPGYVSETTKIEHPAYGGAERALANAEEMAKARGVPLDQVFDEIAFEIEQIENVPALRKQRLDLERKAARAQGVHDRLVGQAKGEAPDILKSQGGTMPMRARRALDAATRLRQQASEIDVRTLREGVGLTPEQAALREAGPSLTDLRPSAYKMAEEYRAQGWSAKDAARAAVQRIRSPGLDPEMAPLAAQWDRVLRPLVREERRRGVIAATLSDPYLNWVSHSLTPEAAEFIARNDLFANTLEAAWRRKFSARNASHMRRKAAYEGMPVREMEADFRAKFPEYQGQFFNPDPMAMVAKRAAQTERSVSTAGLVRNVAEDFARQIPEGGIVPTGWIAMDNVTADSGHVIAEGFLKKMGLQTQRISPRGAATPTSLGQFKGMMLPKEIAEAIIRRIEITKSPAARGAFMQTLVAATDSFKWMTTRLFPEFYVRNFNSDVFRNFEAGIINPMRYLAAGRMLRDAAGTGERTWTLGGKAYTSKAIKDLMDAGGIYRSGMAADAGAGIASASKGVLAGTERAIRKGAGKVDNLVSAGDNLTRATHFMAKLDEGLPVEDAILSVKKFLFDYKDLSPLERHSFRIAVPFYSWLRFNTPLMLESLVARPGKIGLVGHAMRALDDGEGEGMNTSGVPQWVQRRLYFTNKEEDGSQTNISGFGLPFEDLANFDGPPDKFALNVLSMLNPVLKFPIEKATGIESFRGIPIKNDERANPLMRHLSGIPGGKAFLDWIDFREVREGVYRADPEKLHLMTAPFLAGMNRMGATASRLATDPQGAGIKLATGLRVNPISAQEQTIENMRQSVNLVIKQMEELQAQGVTREIEDKYMIRRDVLPTDPRVLKAMRLQRELSRARKVLGHLSDAQRFAGAQGSLRTGGAR